VRRQWIRLLVVLAAVAMAAGGLVGAGTQARAAVSAPTAFTALPSLHVRAVGLPKNARNTSAVTPPAGNVTVDIDLGIAYGQTQMQDWINKVQGENPRISDTIERFLQDRPVNFPGGTTTPALPQFDGTLSLDSDGTGLSFTLPASEADVQTSVTWWQAFLIGVASFLVASLVIGGCLVVFPAAAAICGGVGWAVAGFVGSVIAQAVNGTLGSVESWLTSLAAAVVGFVAGTGAANPVGTWLVTKLPGYVLAFATYILNKLAAAWSWLISLSIWQSVANFLTNIYNGLGNAISNALQSAVAASSPCDTYDAGGNPCAAAYSTVRALYAGYDGPLYRVQRASDNTTADIGLLSTGGYVDAAQQDSFCSGTTCTITKIYDQSPAWNDLTIEGPGGNGGQDQGAVANALPITVNGHEAYGIDVTGGIGYRDDSTSGIATDGAPEGMYMVASGTNVNSGCCFDFGNAETNNDDNGAGHMDAVNLTTYCEFSPCSGSGPWVEADLENGQYMGGGGSNTADTSSSSDFVTAVLKNNGQTTFELEGGNAQSGGLTKYWDGNLPGGYSPMHQEGAIVLGTGGDNSNSDVGSFFEGVMTQGFPSDAADAAVQANIVSAGYAGNSGSAPGGGGSGSGSDVMPSAAGPAVVHTAGATGLAASGFSSVYTVDAGTHDLQETYLPYVGDAWTTQNLSAKYGTPPVMPGTQPVAIVHCGYTSVFTVDANGDLQETYLSNIGNSWATHNLTTLYGTPPTDVTPTAVVHDAGATGLAAACGFTSVYTVDSSNGDLQETYLPYIGDAWTTQNLSVNYGTPPVWAGTSPVSLVHCGYTSVWTVDANGDLQETYLSNIGNAWATHNLTTLYGTLPTDVTPTAVVHDAGATGLAAACGFTSVYTVDSSNGNLPENGDLQETYLPYIGDAWTTQNLSVNYGTPAVSPGIPPVALYHTGYTSVYTVDKNSGDLQETYLSNIGNSWATHNLTALYGTPPTDQTPVVLLHPAPSGSLTWTSVYTLDNSSDDLQETYLPAIGDAWTTQNLSANYGTPPSAAP
jgi:hypothetical protein